MPDYVFNLEALPPGEYKATISILKDGRKEIAVVTKTQPDAKIPLIQVPFVISHRPLYELPPHDDLIDRFKLLHPEGDPFNGPMAVTTCTIIEQPTVIPANKEALT